jgi:hypothetical protein
VKYQSICQKKLCEFVLIIQPFLSGFLRPVQHCGDLGCAERAHGVVAVDGGVESKCSSLGLDAGEESGGSRAAVGNLGQDSPNS